MKGIVVAALAMILTLTMANCANDQDVLMVEHNMEAEIEIARAKSAAIQAQAAAIEASLEGETSDLERYLARNQIAGLMVTPSGVKSVTTGNDVVLTIASDGRAIVRDLVTGVVLYRGIVGLTDAIANAGDTTVSVEGEGNSVDLAQSDVKQIVAGENNTANANTSGNGGSDASGEGEFDTCEQAVQAAEENCDMETNLGAVMTCLSAESGCPVDIVDGQVMIDGEFPHEYLNSKWGDHEELGGS